MPGAENILDDDIRWQPVVALDLANLPSSGVPDGPVRKLLEPILPESWSLFAVDGSWIYEDWANGDLGAIAGDVAFLDRIASEFPGVTQDVVAWILGEGDLSVRGGEFDGSPLDKYLTRLYSPEISREIWQISRLVVDAEGPFAAARSKPHERLAKHLSDHPELVERLAAIWHDEPM
jgi:hypothetical protein